MRLLRRNILIEAELLGLAEPCVVVAKVHVAVDGHALSSQLHASPQKEHTD